MAGVSLGCCVVIAACSAYSEKVSSDVCPSGRRWTAGNTGNEEMRPGTDCVACHIENDAPPFLAAGTVFEGTDNQRQIENDCYGLEGVEVSIEGADGRTFTTTTNLAGNFYFDGDPELLPKPYVARLRYTLEDGTVIAPQMVVPEPSYGGCARCHDRRATEVPGIDALDPRFVSPAEGLFIH
jgi:hypothetical protein